MKKAFVIGLIFISIDSALFAEDAIPSETFRGPVQSVVEEQAVSTLQADGNFKLSNRVLRKKSVATADGNVSEQTSYTESGSFGQKDAYHYNGENKIADWIGYDAADKILWKYTYSYDQLGRMIEEDSYDAAGALEGQEKYAYDNSTPILLSKTTLDGKGEKKSIYTYSYDAAKRPIGWQTQYADGTVHKKNVKEYDSDGRLKEEYSMDASGAVFERIAYSYLADQSGSKVSSYDDTGKLRDETRSLRDQYGNIIEESHFRADGTLDWKNSYDYRYDEHLNWTQKSFTQESQQFGKIVAQLRSVTYRTIVYAASPVPVPAPETPGSSQNSLPAPVNGMANGQPAPPLPQTDVPAKK